VTADRDVTASPDREAPPVAPADDSSVLDVAYAVDAGYLAQLAASLTSLVTHCSDPGRLRVTVVHEDVPPAAQDWIRGLLPHPVRVRFLALESERVAALPLPARISPWITPVSFSRLLLPELLPESDRVLYLDADTVVLGDVLGITATELGGKPLAAAVDPIIPTWGSRGGVQNAAVRAGREETAYFNSGVQLMNLPVWRATGLAEAAFAYALREGEALLLADQEMLNAVVAGDFVRLDPVWNTSAFHLEQLPSPQFEERLARTRVLHYLGERKPWHDHAVPRRVDRPYLDHVPHKLPA
jgi:lipopolysaccharide biosynthesis glycosyltransferase